jgi:hypothetical protein
MVLIVTQDVASGRNITFFNGGRVGREVISSLERAVGFSLVSMFVASSHTVGLMVVKSMRYWRGLGEDQSTKK